jgi:transposase
VLLPRQQAKLARRAIDEEHAMSQTANTAIAVIGIDIGKNSFHVVGHARRHRAAAKVVAWPSGSAARHYTALPDRHGSLRRRTSPEPQTRIGHDARLTPAKYVRP